MPWLACAGTPGAAETEAAGDFWPGLLACAAPRASPVSPEWTQSTISDLIRSMNKCLGPDMCLIAR